MGHTWVIFVIEVFDPIEESLHTLSIPDNTCFIHGLKTWDRNGCFNLVGEISVSLHQEGYTTPLRDFGFVIALKEIIAAFACDITSKIENGKKVLSWQSRRGVRRYDETCLDQLIQNTSKGRHNELWVASEKIEIIGGYYIGEGHDLFKKAMTRKGLPLERFNVGI